MKSESADTSGRNLPGVFLGICDGEALGCCMGKPGSILGGSGASDGSGRREEAQWASEQVRAADARSAWRLHGETGFDSWRERSERRESNPHCQLGKLMFYH